jgi:hypothetical protein
MYVFWEERGSIWESGLMVVKREFWSGFSVRLRRAEAQGLAPGREAEGNSCHWGWEMTRRWSNPGMGAS